MRALQFAPYHSAGVQLPSLTLTAYTLAEPFKGVMVTVVMPLHPPERLKNAGPWGEKVGISATESPAAHVVSANERL